MDRPLIVGITGGIGGGKSTLAEKLRMAGYNVFDSDMEARKLQNEDPDIRREMIVLFGADVYNENGLDRKKVAGIVFQNKDLLQKLNELIHPALRKEFLRWIESHQSNKLLFVESAILFERGMYLLADKVILMTAQENVRIARVMKRDKVTLEQVKARMSNQLPEEEKIAKSDYVIYSDDHLPLDEKMKKILTELLSLI